MSAAKHTPGTWFAREWSRHAATTVLVDDLTAVTGKRVIAECETEEDARLIAAAREMLAVLLKLRRGDLHQRVRPLFDEAQAAIAKATGSAA